MPSLQSVRIPPSGLRLAQPLRPEGGRAGLGFPYLNPLLTVGAATASKGAVNDLPVVDRLNPLATLVSAVTRFLSVNLVVEGRLNLDGWLVVELPYFLAARQAPPNVNYRRAPGMANHRRMMLRCAASLKVLHVRSL